MTATRTETKEERKLRAAAEGLGLTVDLEPGPGGPPLLVVESPERAMAVSPELIRAASPERLHCILAAFGQGATAIHFGPHVLTLVTRPKYE